MYHTKPFFRTKRWVAICIGSQWTSEFITSMPFIIRKEPYCAEEIWMQIYTCLIAVFIPTLIDMVLYGLIFLYARSSSRRVQPQNVSTSTNSTNIQQELISRRNISVLRQMFFMFSMFIGGWAPAYLTIIIGNFIDVDPIVLEITTILSELCILSIIINLFICNHDLRQYLSNKIRRVFEHR